MAKHLPKCRRPAAAPRASVPEDGSWEEGWVDPGRLLPGASRDQPALAGETVSSWSTSVRGGVSSGVSRTMR